MTEQMLLLLYRMGGNNGGNKFGEIASKLHLKNMMNLTK